MTRLFIGSVLMLSGCCQLIAQPAYEGLLHKTYAQRADQLKNITENIAIFRIVNNKTLKDLDSASVFPKIAQFRHFAEEHRNKELILEADLIAAIYYKSYRAGNTEQVVSSFENIIHKAAAAGLLIMEARAQALMADYYFRIKGYYELGFEKYFQTEQLIQQLPYEAYPDKLINIYEIAAAYYFFADYRSAINYCRQALQLQPVPFNVRTFNSARNTLGLCYQAMGNLDSSDYYFKRLLNKKDPSYMAVWESIAKGNLGYNCYLRGEYEKAIPLFEADISTALATGDLGLASGSLIPLADIYLKLNRRDGAEKLLWQAKEYVIASGQYKRYASLYPVMSKFYASKGQLALSNLYLDSAIYVKDSVARKFSALQLLRAKQKAELQQHRAEIDRIASEKQIKTLERNLLIGFVFVLIAWALYVYRNQKRKHRHKEFLLDLELKNKEKELAVATGQLTDFAKSISEKNNLIETLEHQFGENSNNTALEQLRQVTILTDEEWERFRSLFSQVHSGYLQRLKEKLPALTPAETRFMALAKLGFSNKEMAAVLGVSSNNIRNIWHRMRQKFNLPEEASFGELAETI